MRTLLLSAALSLVCIEAQAQSTVPVAAPAPYTQWKVPPNDPVGTTYNLGNETFYFRNSSNPDPLGPCRYTGSDALQTNPYPIRNSGQVTNPNQTITYYGTENARFLGGKIVGDISLVADGAVTSSNGGYCNGAAIVSTSNVSRTQNVIGTRIDRVWDGIRFNVEPCYSEPGGCQQFVESVWVSNTRDDAVECDFFGCQAIRDSLFDGVFSFLSIRPTSSTAKDYAHTGQPFVIEDNLVRLKGFPYTSSKWGGVANYHIGFIKTDPAKAPDIIVRNTVIAADFYHSVTWTEWQYTWASLSRSECSNNVFLWLPTTPVPAGILPPSDLAGCFTVLSGSEAQCYWTAARAAWIEDHPEVAQLPGDLDPPTFQ
jgi:hypothetical protein